MHRRGWLLDPYIRGKDAHLWVKTIEGETLHLTERHRPLFIVQPKPDLSMEDLCYLLEEHKLVHSAKPVERYATLRKERLERVAEVRVDSAGDLDNVVAYARSLREV